MFPHDQAQRRQLADLPAFPPHDGRVRGQRLLAALAQHRPVLDHHVGRRHQPQRLAPMPQLPAGLGFSPLRVRRRFVLRARASLDGGLELSWLSVASRASNSCTRTTGSAICSRCRAFSTRKAAISSSGVMPLR
jgi:hypothetical protein